MISNLSIRQVLSSRYILIMLALAVSLPTLASAEVKYVDVSESMTDVKNFQRVGSSTVQAFDALYEKSLVEPITFSEVISAPMMPRGLPGVVIFDVDSDGDNDFYATNGVGAANGLFLNTLKQTGELNFINISKDAGIDNIDQDSFGACAGDLDNDGDQDLMVLGRLGENLLFENLGGLRFRKVQLNGAASGSTMTSASCSIGDIDNDGLLDIAIANSFDQTNSIPILVEPYALNEHNQLLKNQGQLSFEDVSIESGITINEGYPAGAAGITWAVVMADIDTDGDVDIIFMDDQGAIPSSRHPEIGGFDRAFIHLFVNDGTGHFDGRIVNKGSFAASEWMGVSVGDLNCDSNLDIFASSFGDYATAVAQLPYTQPGSMTRPLFGNGDGTFNDPQNTFGPLAMPFGWGNAAYEYDNDGDLDLLVHGGLLGGPVFLISDNPGVLLKNNNCEGLFEEAVDVFSVDHLSRNVRGVAVGDLNNDGFNDIVTISSLSIPSSAPKILSPEGSYGSPYDATAFFVPLMSPVGIDDTGLPLFRWTGLELLPGDIRIEIAEPNQNKSVSVELMGTVGIADGATVNRDGVGGQITVGVPGIKNKVMQAVTAGSSHSSQHSTHKIFGLGNSKRADIEVLWPGGVRNKFYGVRAGQFTAPEIPCSFDTQGSFRDYWLCTRKALIQLRGAGILSRLEYRQFSRDVIRAYFEYRFSYR